MSDPDKLRATRIVVHWSDGSIGYADGEQAAELMEWWASCEIASGKEYGGEPLKRYWPNSRPVRIGREDKIK